MRLITYNIHKGVGGIDRRYELERICAVLAEHQADVLCLQEVTRHARRTRYDDQPTILAKRFGAEHTSYQMNVHYRSGGYGNLILSRWPIERRHEISLRLRKRKPRGAQLAVIDTPSGPLHLANWHLGLRGGERIWQADRLLSLPLFQEWARFPTLVVGDFNDGRNRLASRLFAAHEFEQATGVTREFRTFPAFLPMLTLDRVFHRGAITIRRVRVLRGALARRASDHLPLLLEFELAASGSNGDSRLA